MRAKPPIPIASMTFGFLLLLLLLPVTCIPVAMPPELTLDLPLSQIPGVWKLTRLVLLLGPTPILWAYRKGALVVEEAMPSFRRSLLNTAESLQTWIGALVEDEGFDIDGFPNIAAEKEREREAVSTAALVLGSGANVIPTVCLQVYKEIIADPRLRRQRLRDSRTVLGDGPQMSLRDMYREYWATLETTIVVAREHIAAAQLQPEHARLVQNLVMTRMEAR